MNAVEFSFRAFIAIFAAAFLTPVVSFALLVALNQVGSGWAHDLLGVSQILFFGAAIALLPSAALGLLVELPQVRHLKISFLSFVLHVIMSVAGAIGGAQLLLVLTRGSSNVLHDSFLFPLVCALGVCSAVSWWFIVALPRRAASLANR